MSPALRCALICALLLTSACGKDAAEVVVPEPQVNGNTIVFPDPGKAPKLQADAVKYEPAAKVRLNGKLVWDEERTVRVYSPFAGRVNRILVQPGMAVRKGQALATLGSPEFGQAQSDARRAEADMHLAEANLQRQKELEAYGVAPRKDLQTAEAEYARNRVELDRARGRVRLYGGNANSVDQSFTIASPIEGVVVERNINPGQELRPDQNTSGTPALFVVTEPSRLWAILDASEKDLGVVDVGRTVSLRTPVYPEVDFNGKIISVSDFLDPATRTLKVRAAVPNTNRKLKAEMFVTAEIETRQGLRMLVPSKAVYFQGGLHYVITEEGPGRFTRREVSVGEEHDGATAIVGGLTVGQRVVADDVLMLQQMLQPRRIQK